MKKSKAFTLAETIMTLFIVGLVVTASIPMFTKKPVDPQTDATLNNKNNYPWTFCNDDRELGLCQAAPYDRPIVIRSANSDDPDGNYALTVHTGSDKYISPYDMFKSDARDLFIGNYIFKEARTNLFIQGANEIRSNSSDATSIVIGKNNLNSNGNYNKSVIIGNSNTNQNGSNMNTIVGNNNIQYNNVSTIIGENNNTIGVVNVIIGNNNNTHNNTTNNIFSNNPSQIRGTVAIGSGIGTEASRDANLLNIGEYIIAANKNELTFRGSASLHGEIAAGQLTTTSDERLKNIKGAYTKGLKEVLEVEPVIYRYKGQNTKRIGVIAQDLQKTFPEAVVKMPDGYFGVNTDPVFFAMLNAMKEVNQKAEEEEQKQIKLQKELEEIKAELETLSACKNDDFWSKVKCFWYDTKMFFKSLIACHCEERSDEAISLKKVAPCHSQKCNGTTKQSTSLLSHSDMKWIATLPLVARNDMQGGIA